jgi:phosphoribosylformimino-5-aminoimidazole carboxamide ribonucleotide (ProFAR) isomerase
MDDTTVFSDNPVDMAVQWVAQGARRLHLVDLNGAFEGKPMKTEKRANRYHSDMNNDRVQTYRRVL